MLHSNLIKLIFIILLFHIYACRKNSLPGLVPDTSKGSKNSTLYIANKNRLFACIQNLNVGTFSACNDTGAEGLINPSSAIIVNKVLYIADFDASKIYQCDLINENKVKGCSDSQAYMPIQNDKKPHPHYLKHLVVNNTDYIYVVFTGANYEYNGVYKYKIDPQFKTLINQKEEPLPNSYPLQLLFNNNIAYLLNFSNFLSSCNLNENGDLINCSKALILDGSSNKLINGNGKKIIIKNNYIFIQLNGDFLFSCPLTSNGKIDTLKCNKINLDFFSKSFGMSLIHEYLYLDSINSSKIQNFLKCNIVENNIENSNCINANPLNDSTLDKNSPIVMIDQ